MAIALTEPIRQRESQKFEKKTIDYNSVTLFYSGKLISLGTAI